VEACGLEPARSRACISRVAGVGQRSASCRFPYSVEEVVLMEDSARRRLRLESTTIWNWRTLHGSDDVLPLADRVFDSLSSGEKQRVGWREL